MGKPGQDRPIPAFIWNGVAKELTDQKEIDSEQSGAMSGGDLVNWLLSQGFSLEAIKIMFPGLLPNFVIRDAQHWSREDWIRQFHFEPDHDTGEWDYDY